MQNKARLTCALKQYELLKKVTFEPLLFHKKVKCQKNPMVMFRKKEQEETHAKHVGSELCSISLQKNMADFAQNTKKLA
jgi:hypothetical protein